MPEDKRKGTPEGAPVHTTNGTTRVSQNQWLAEIWFDTIGKYDKPIKRPKNPSVDRAFRKLIEHANTHGDCIINDGAGYYRPVRGDGFDEHCFELYKAKERAKIRKIESKLEAMDKAFYGGTNNGN